MAFARPLGPSRTVRLLACSRSRSRAVQDLAVATTEAEDPATEQGGGSGARWRSPVHRVRRLLTKSQMKGAEQGGDDADRQLGRCEQGACQHVGPSSRPAPGAETAATGGRGWDRASSRTRWGTTSPTKADHPDTATATPTPAAVSKDEAALPGIARSLPDAGLSFTQQQGVAGDWHPRNEASSRGRQGRQGPAPHRPVCLPPACHLPQVAQVAEHPIVREIGEQAG